jgi:hypothetical protein
MAVCVPPGLKRVTCLPTDSTTPAPSDPGTTGSLIGNGYLPLGIAKSRKLSEAAWTMKTLEKLHTTEVCKAHTLNKNVLVANLLNRCLLFKFQRVEAILACYGPLLGT